MRLHDYDNIISIAFQATVSNPPKTSEAQQLFITTRTLSYRVFYFTLYRLGLRLGEGLRLEVGDIDAQRLRVHVRDAKGNKDRLVPLPETTLNLLRRFWQVLPAA